MSNRRAYRSRVFEFRDWLIKEKTLNESGT